MTLADDIYAILNGALWTIATIPKPLRVIIAQQAKDVVMLSRDLVIISRETGTFEPSASDGSDDIRHQGFTIMGMEQNQTDVGKMIAMIKKCLKRSSATATGTYRITNYEISREPLAFRYTLTGNLQKIIEDDAF